MGSAPLSGDRVCFIDKASCFLLKLWVHWKDKMHGNPRKVKLTSSAKTLELWGAVTPMWPEQKQRHRSQCPLWSPCDCGSWGGGGQACSLQLNQASPGFSPAPGRLCPVPLYSSPSSPLSLAFLLQHLRSPLLWACPRPAVYPWVALVLKTPAFCLCSANGVTGSHLQTSAQAKDTAAASVQMEHPRE